MDGSRAGLGVLYTGMTASGVSTDVTETPRGATRTVLHLFSRLDPGGAEMRTLEMLEAMRNEPHLRTIIGVTGSRGGTLEARFERAGATIVDLPLGLGFPLALRRQVAAHQVNVLHAHSSTASGLFMMLGAILSVDQRIAHFRSDSDGRAETPRRRTQRGILRLLIRLFATDVVGVSPGALAFAGAWASRSSRGRVVPSGLRSPVLPAPSARQERRDRLGLAPDETLLIHVGRDRPLKNRPRAVELLAELVDRGSPTTLLMLGRLGPGEAQELRAAAERRGVAGRLVLAGQVDDVTAYLADADVTLVTSFREGLPGVVLESVAVGTPVVSSDVPGSVWIAQTFDTVQCLSLEAADAEWCEAVDRAPRALDHESRVAAVAAFERSLFSLTTARLEFARLWRIQGSGGRQAGTCAQRNE